MKVLFVGQKWGGMSAMALGLAKKRFKADIDVQIAAVESAATDALAVEVMKEIGIDLQGGADVPRLLASVDVKAFDLVVVVGERDVVPKDLGGPKKVHWPIPEPREPPAGRDELLRRFRDARAALDKHLLQIGKLSQHLA